MAVCCSLIVGGFLGSAAGYFGGKIDMVIMRCMDILLAIPNILLAITIVARPGRQQRELDHRVDGFERARLLPYRARRCADSPRCRIHRGGPRHRR